MGNFQLGTLRLNIGVDSELFGPTPMFRTLGPSPHNLYREGEGIGVVLLLSSKFTPVRVNNLHGSH